MNNLIVLLRGDVTKVDMLLESAISVKDQSKNFSNPHNVNKQGLSTQVRSIKKVSE